MTGVIPFCIIASIIALEHGAQHVWRRTVVSPIGACMALCLVTTNYQLLLDGHKRVEGVADFLGELLVAIVVREFGKI